MTVDLERFERTPLAREPFEHLVVRGFVKPEARKAINDDYPKLQRPGSFPLSETTFGPKFKELIDDLVSREFRAAFERNSPSISQVGPRWSPCGGAARRRRTEKSTLTQERKLWCSFAITEGQHKTQNVVFKHEAFEPGSVVYRSPSTDTQQSAEKKEKAFPEGGWICKVVVKKGESVSR
ncbi:MAG: hypothetical protein WB586_08730 [Chthoniobacterales bacterium]